MSYDPMREARGQVTLRVNEPMKFDIERIGRHEPAHAGGIVPCAEVIEAGLGVAFFAGEFVGRRLVIDQAVVHVGQPVVVESRRDLARMASMHSPARKPSMARQATRYMLKRTSVLRVKGESLKSLAPAHVLGKPTVRIHDIAKLLSVLT